MDNRANLHESLFSRNSTPPTNQQPPQLFSPHISNNSTPSLIDSLFQGIPAPSSDSHSIHNVDMHSGEDYDSHAIAAPMGPFIMPEEPVASPSSNTERQNALLSLLGGGPTSTNRAQQVIQQPQNQPQQVPTPPGSISQLSQRSNASPQGTDPQKLLEQIMGGNTSRSTNYSDTQRSNPQAPSPPYTGRDDYRSYPHEHSTETSPRTRTIQHPPVSQQSSQQQQQQPPSPRRSMFEFTSAFDHLSSAGSIKKKNVPPQPSSISSGGEESSWTAVIDPKRQSVENLLENLTRGQPQQAPPQPPAYEAYLSGDYSPADQAPSRAPLPPIPASSKPVAIPTIPNVSGSPRGGSPKNQLHRPQPRAVDANSSQQIPFPGPGDRRGKDGSPGPRGKNGSQRVPQPQNKFTKPPVSPGPQSQTIIFDVSQALEEIQARDSVKSTAIALVRQDSVFLPGSTIGATHWVAYAMTRGRVRVISRSSGDRTLLQLPQVFSSTSSVIDMAVYSNRLAGVTSDGGFVVWELPEVITDDVPGRILLCVPPTNDNEAIRAVKWHPKDPDTLAIASDNKIYVIDLASTQALHGPLPHADLFHIGQQFNVPSTVVAFDFDVVHYALATISEDSSLTVWNMHDTLPYASHKIYGEDVPSSLTFVDGGIVVGRKNGTIFQLLSMTTKTVLSTVKFVDGGQEDPDMFGHVSYDSRIQTLWVANSRRESLIALKVHIEPSFSGGEESVRGFIEQVAEFSGIKPTIHFVILTADADPHGDEAHAACVAAKISAGELALVAFSVHSSGVDQVLIRKEWFDLALRQAESKYPLDVGIAATPPQQQQQHLVVGVPPPAPAPAPAPPPVAMSESKQPPMRQPLPPIPPPTAPQLQPTAPSFVPPRARTPPSDDVENDFSEGRGESKKGGAKGKNVNWKEKDDSSSKEVVKASKSSDVAVINESALGQALTKEIKKTEDSLHRSIGRLIGKEMDKQNQRFEEARLHEQAEDFARQEKILKLISTELTRNTTRVVEQAVKNEVQQSVLPSLENITRAEVKAALNEHIGNGLIEVVNRGLPGEMEKVLLRPSIANHYSNLLTQTLMPVLERQVKDTLSATFMQFHSQHSANLQQELMRELRTELSTMKADLGSWHNEAMRSQDATIRELERTVRALADQVKFLSLNPPQPTFHHIAQTQQPQNSPGGPPAPQLQSNVGPSQLRQTIPPAMNQAPVSYPAHQSFQQQQQPFQQQPPPPQQQQQQQPLAHNNWYSGIAAPQASHPATIPQPPPSAPQRERTPPTKPDEWDEKYLSVLHMQDAGRLRDLLSQTNPDVVLPLTGTPLVSQAVILTLIHRLSAIVGDTLPNDESFKTLLWWLQRVTILLRPDDKLIADFIPRVIPTVQQSLNATKQRLTIIPGGSTAEVVRQVSEVQESLRSKVRV